MLRPHAARAGMPPVTISPSELDLILGPAKFARESAERLCRPGVALGLAWTAAGGELLFVETILMGGKGELIVTGQVG